MMTNGDNGFDDDDDKMTWGVRIISKNLRASSNGPAGVTPTRKA